MKVSIIIPSRQERFLDRTIQSLLANARGDIEILAVLDGYWPDPPLPEDPRLIQLHRGQWQGMRPGINVAAEVATGDYLMKIDGHCDVAEGFDVELARECEGDWLVVPRRYSLDPDKWCPDKTRPTVDAHYLSWPFARPGDKTCGLHGNVWAERAKARKDVLLDDEMSSQGSFWFMSRKHWRRLGPMEVGRYGTFAQEFQEIGMKTWLGGGRVAVNKRTWYAHLHKGKRFGTGYGFSNAQWEAWAVEKEQARVECIRYWMLDQWKERKRDMRWLIEKFAPVPGWPTDLDAAFAQARAELA